MAAAQTALAEPGSEDWHDVKARLGMEEAGRRRVSRLRALGIRWLCWRLRKIKVRHAEADLAVDGVDLWILRGHRGAPRPREGVVVLTHSFAEPPSLWRGDAIRCRVDFRPSRLVDGYLVRPRWWVLLLHYGFDFGTTYVVPGTFRGWPKVPFLPDEGSPWRQYHNAWSLLAGRPVTQPVAFDD